MFYANLVWFMTIWLIFPHFGILCQDKSGNPSTPSTVSTDLSRFSLSAEEKNVADAAANVQNYSN
jgi:hypothetical protein